MGQENGEEGLSIVEGHCGLPPRIHRVQVLIITTTPVGMVPGMETRDPVELTCLPLQVGKGPCKGCFPALGKGGRHRSPGLGNKSGPPPAVWPSVHYNLRRW